MWKVEDDMAFVWWDDRDPDLMPPHRIDLSEVEIVEHVDDVPFGLPEEVLVDGAFVPDGDWPGDLWRERDALDEELRGVPPGDVYGS